MVEQNETGKNERFKNAIVVVKGLVAVYFLREIKHPGSDQNTIDLFSRIAGDYPEYKTSIGNIEQILGNPNICGSYNVLNDAYNLHRNRQDTERLPETERGIGEFLFFSILANRIDLNPQQEDSRPVARGFLREVSQMIEEIGLSSGSEDKITAEMVVGSALSGRLRLIPNPETPN